MADLRHPRTLALLVEMAGSACLVWAILEALWALRTGPRAGGAGRGARARLADGVVVSLGFKAAASLLKLLTVQTWSQIGLCAVTPALRTVPRRVFAAEAARARGGAQ